MFNPKLEVPSLELCKQLKYLGFPQDGGGWYWYSDIENATWRLVYEQEVFDYDEDIKEYIKAPTVRELGEWLPVSIKDIHELYIEFDKVTEEDWIISYRYYCHNISLIVFKDITEANARAKMLIWLVENNYITFNKEVKNAHNK